MIRVEDIIMTLMANKLEGACIIDRSSHEGLVYCIIIFVRSI